MFIKDDYIINHKTQAFLQYENSSFGCHTIVKEVSKTILVKQSPLQIIKQTQAFHNFAVGEPKRLKHVYDMLAIQIAPYISIGLCPTTNHVWISPSHIKRLEKNLDGRMKIYFTNEKVMTLYPKGKAPTNYIHNEKKEGLEALKPRDGLLLCEETSIQYTIQFKGRRRK